MESYAAFKIVLNTNIENIETCVFIKKRKKQISKQWAMKTPFLLRGAGKGGTGRNFNWMVGWMGVGWGLDGGVLLVGFLCGWFTCAHIATL